MKEFYLSKSEGEITNRQTVRKALNDLEDGHYLVKIHKRNKRSSPQNRYFHGPMLDIVLQGLRDAGFNEVKTKEDAKLVVKSLFLKRSIESEDGIHVIEIVQDTHNLTKLEMNEFIEEVIKWGAEYLGVQIPYPNEQLLINY